MSIDEKSYNELIEKYQNNVVSMPPSADLQGIMPLTYGEMRNSVPKPLENILHPWLPTQGIAFIYAATGVGKTMFTLNTAYAIADGGNFLKFSAPKPRKVLYVDGEMCYNQLHSRFDQIVRQQGDMQNFGNWHLLTPDKVLPHKLPRICDPAGQRFYNDLIEKLGIEVLILDNLSTLSAIDENKSEEWKVVQEWLISLRGRQISTIVVHHAGKDSHGYRGTSRMLDCVDTAISLQLVSSDGLENENLHSKKFKIEFQKARTFSGEEALSFEVTLSKTGWGFQSFEKTIIEMVAERINIKMSHKEIALELRVSRPYITKIAKKARDAGLLREQ